MSEGRGKGSKLWGSAEEVREPEKVEIRGNIPKWLNGTYFRIGPGKFDFENDFTLNHWFDGYAILQRYEISSQDQTVSFQSKYLDSDAYRRALAAGKPAVTEYGTPAHAEAGKGFFSRVITNILPEVSDNTNVSLFTLGGPANVNAKEIFTCADPCYFHSVDPSSLRQRDKYDASKFSGVNVHSPHPLTDPVSGYTYNIGSAVSLTGAKYIIFRVPPSDMSPKEAFKRAKVICSISSHWPSMASYIHSFGMTPNYLVFIEQPYFLSVAKILGSGFHSKAQSSRDWLDWRPEALNRFYLIEKATGRIVSKGLEILSAFPFFFVHVINCYEEGGQVIVDINSFETPSVLDSQNLGSLRAGVGLDSAGLADDPENQARSLRFVIPLGAELAEAEVNLVTSARASAIRKGKILTLTPEPILGTRGLELPGINPKVRGSAYRYYYGSGLTSRGQFKNSVVKVDVGSGEVKVWRESEHQIYGEPVFTSRPGVKMEEDEGLLIVPMTDSREGQPDSLFFLEPKDMTETGRAVFRNRVPPAIHGLYLSKEDSS